MNKIEIFKQELYYITNQNIKSFTENLVSKLPDYFFEIPASSTGKYHPQYATGEGGLVRHTKAAVRIAVELFRINDLYTEEEKDCIIAALILHDGLKSGKEKVTFTVHDHPVLIAEFIKQNKDNNITDDQLKIIMNAVSSHMGRWSTSNYSEIVLPIPISKIERFVHLCDYLASRKCLEFNFDAEVKR